MCPALVRAPSHLKKQGCDVRKYNVTREVSRQNNSMSSLQKRKMRRVRDQARSMIGHKPLFATKQLYSYQSEEALCSIFVSFWNSWKKIHNFCEKGQSHLCLGVRERQFALCHQNVTGAINLMVPLKLRSYETLLD